MKGLRWTGCSCSLGVPGLTSNAMRGRRRPDLTPRRLRRFNPPVQLLRGQDGVLLAMTSASTSLRRSGRWRRWRGRLDRVPSNRVWQKILRERGPGKKMFDRNNQVFPDITVRKRFNVVRYVDD